MRKVSHLRLWDDTNCWRIPVQTDRRVRRQRKTTRRMSDPSTGACEFRAMIFLGGYADGHGDREKVTLVI